MVLFHVILLCGYNLNILLLTLRYIDLVSFSNLDAGWTRFWNFGRRETLGVTVEIQSLGSSSASLMLAKMLKIRRIHIITISKVHTAHVAGHILILMLKTNWRISNAASVRTGFMRSILVLSPLIWLVTLVSSCLISADHLQFPYILCEITWWFMKFQGVSLRYFRDRSFWKLLCSFILFLDSCPSWRIYDPSVMRSHISL